MRRPFFGCGGNRGTAPISRSLGSSIQQDRNGEMMRWCYGQVGLVIPSAVPVINH